MGSSARGMRDGYGILVSLLGKGEGKQQGVFRSWREAEEEEENKNVSRSLHKKLIIRQESSKLLYQQRVFCVL